MRLPTKILSLIERGALFVLNDSGGKDSQAMKIVLEKLVPKEQLVIIHAHLPEVEWEGSIEFIKANAMGIPVHVCQANKTFFEMIEKRGMFPDVSRRQCTSDLKRGPIQKKIREIGRAQGKFLIVNCMGLRAQESSNRAKKRVFTKNKTTSNSIWEWYDWLPIHKYTTKKVFKTIEDAGQVPFWVYAAGMTRKSCKICIMSSDEDICTAAKLDPNNAAKYIDFEQRRGHTLRMNRKPLTEILNRNKE